MVIALRLLFVLILASMLGVTVWASLHTPLSELPRAVWGHPWFIAAMVAASCVGAAAAAFDDDCCDGCGVAPLSPPHASGSADKTQRTAAVAPWGVRSV